jgi:hypothetical protein
MNLIRFAFYYPASKSMILPFPESFDKSELMRNVVGVLRIIAVVSTSLASAVKGNDQLTKNEKHPEGKS